MSFLRKRGPKPAEITQYSGLQIQTSSSAVPITIAYGINKLAANLIWYGSFTAIPEYTKTGGKGGGRKTLSGFNYTAGIMLGLCEGPIRSVGAVWKDQGVYQPWALNLNVSHGDAATQNLAYNQDVTYKGLAYVWSPLYDLGASATIGALQFEVYGQQYESAVVNAHDADPARVIYDFLTNQQYGVGFPAGSIDASTLLGASGTATYQAYCWAVGIGISPVLANRETASSILTRWLQLTNSAAVWSEGKLKFIPYGDERVDSTLYDGTPVSFVPDVTPLYDLSDDDFVVTGPDEDPVLVEVKDPYSSFNVQELEISDRKYRYNSATITVWDQNAIERFGRRDGSTITAHEICDKAIGQIVAQLILQREVYIRNMYSFKLSFEFCLLEPMDIVTLTDTALGLDKEAVRIVSIEEDDDGLLNVTAEEFPEGTATAAAYPVQASEAIVVDWNVVPSAVNPPVIFEPPSSLTKGERQIWIGVSGGLATAYKLEEDGSSGFHYVAKSLAAEGVGTFVEFKAYVKAAERSNVALQIFLGNDGSDKWALALFDLVAGTGQVALQGIGYSIDSEGDGWWKISVYGAMVQAVAPSAFVLLANSSGSQFYAGTAGNGLYVWGVSVGASLDAVSMIEMPMIPVGAIFDADAQDPPAGAEGTADPYWGGCFIHVSTDDVTYGQIGQVNGPSRQGVTSAALGSGDSLLSVNLGMSGGTLEPASTVDASSGVTLSLVEDELLAYGGAALTGTNAYNLSGLVRGMYGTAVPESHPSGSRFARFDNSIFKYVLPAAYVGQVLYLKFQSFNIFGLGVQDLATCSTYTYTPTGVGSRSSILELLSQGFDVRLPSISATAVREPMIPINQLPSDTVRLEGLP